MMAGVRFLVLVLLLFLRLANSTGEHRLVQLTRAIHLAYPALTVILTPSNGLVCPNESVTFTCVTDDGSLKWMVDNITEVFGVQSQNARQRENFYLQLVNITDGGNRIASTATAMRVSLRDTGKRIACLDAGNYSKTSVITVRGLFREKDIITRLCMHDRPCLKFLFMIHNYECYI